MEEIKSSSPPPPAAAATNTSSSSTRNRETSATSRMKRVCVSFYASLRQGFGYVKAFFVGLAKKITARNEKDAAKADLQKAKMQVEATDDAEDTKARLNKFMILVKIYEFSKVRITQRIELMMILPPLAPKGDWACVETRPNVVCLCCGPVLSKHGPWGSDKPTVM